MATFFGAAGAVPGPGSFGPRRALDRPIVGRHPPACGVLETGVASVYGKTREKEQPAPQADQGRKMWAQQAKQILEVVSPRNEQAEFHEQRLQEFFCGLLAVEANEIILWLPAVCDLLRDAVIGLGLANPLGR
jgi:hypothetical protein